MTPTENTADDELAALRQRRAELAAERERIEASLADELEDERRAIAEDEAINAALAEHGKKGLRWDAVPTDFGLVILKRCTSMRYKKFQDMGDFSSTATEALVETQVLYPAKSVYRTWVDDQPMIATRCANALSRMAGVRKDDIEKK